MVKMESPDDDYVVADGEAYGTTGDVLIQLW